MKPHPGVAPGDHPCALQCATTLVAVLGVIGLIAWLRAFARWPTAVDPGRCFAARSSRHDPAIPGARTTWRLAHRSTQSRRRARTMRTLSSGIRPRENRAPILRPEGARDRQPPVSRTMRWTRSSRARMGNPSARSRGGGVADQPAGRASASMWPMKASSSASVMLMRDLARDDEIERSACSR